MAEIIITDNELALLLQQAISKGYNHTKTDDILRDAWPEALAMVELYLKNKQIRRSYSPNKKILDFFGIKK